MWPVSGWPMGWPVAASQTRSVLSALPEAIRLPLGLNATLHTSSVWPAWVAASPRTPTRWIKRWPR